MKPIDSSADRECGGFTLLEVMLAMALFTMVAVSLTIALNQIGLAAIESTERASRLEIVNSHLEELSKGPLPEIGVRETLLPGQDLILQVEAQELELNTKEGLPLEGMFHISVRVFENLPEAQREVLAEADTYRYEHLYMR